MLQRNRDEMGHETIWKGAGQAECIRRPIEYEPMSSLELLFATATRKDIGSFNFKQMGVLVIKSLESVYFPGWRFVPTHLNRKLKNINEQVETLLRGIISKKEKSIREGIAAADLLGALGLLLELNMKEIRDKKSIKNKKNVIGLSTQDIVHECESFYIAGQEITSTLLVAKPCRG